MTNKTYSELGRKYPNLYKNDVYFECDQGWYDIIDELSQKLETAIINNPNKQEYYATQVKQKYGTLRFYMSMIDDDMEKAIMEGEEKSSKTCEHCGKEGKLISIFGWYLTLCDKCRIEKIREEE